MADTVAAVISARSQEPEGLSRMIVWSVAAHVVFLGALLVMPTPRAHEEPRIVMAISLGGSAGPVTGGQTQMGGRAVEAPPPEAPPPPPRPVEPPPPLPAQPAMTTPPPPTAPRRPQQQPPQPQPRRPSDPLPATPRRTPFAAEQPRPGSTPVETGARGTGAGLSTAGGGGGSGVQLDVENFCCPQYIERMLEQIDRNWNSNHGTLGSTVMRFTIQRDGTISDVRASRPSGHVALDFAAERALFLTNQLNRLPPLPAEFPNRTLTVTLTFVYE